MPRVECAREECKAVLVADSYEKLSDEMDKHYIETALSKKSKYGGFSINHICTVFNYLGANEGRVRSYGNNRWTESEKGIYNGQEGRVPNNLIKKSEGWD